MGAGSIPLNGRMILAKVPHGPASEAFSSSSPTTVDTPKNTSTLPQQTRQAKLILKNHAPLDWGKLWDIIEYLDLFGIVADSDRELKHDTFTKW